MSLPSCSYRLVKVHLIFREIEIVDVSDRSQGFALLRYWILSPIRCDFACWEGWLMKTCVHVG